MRAASSPFLAVGLWAFITLALSRPGLADEASLAARSCPAGQAYLEPRPIDIQAEPVSLMRAETTRTRIGALKLVAGFSLTSSDPRFGGLSGLETIGEGRLLAVTDEGYFVWIDLDRERLAPVAARLAPMRDESGADLTAKTDADAEGLAQTDHLTYVSFERRHRLLAFDLAACGAAARGADVLGPSAEDRIAEAFRRSGLSVGPNAGLEALALTQEGVLIMGLETRRDGASPLSVGGLSADPDFSLGLAPGASELVGIDVLSDEETPGAWRVISLHRGIGRVLGDIVAVYETRLERTDSHPGSGDERIRYQLSSSRRLAGFDLRMSVDNFEGVAVERAPGGGLRLYLVSDDNFSTAQRTLLMIFEWVEEAEDPPARQAEPAERG